MTAKEFQHEATLLRPKLLAVAHRYLADDDAAEDIVQDALLKMWLMVAELRKPMAPLAWVLIRNLSVDYLHHQHPAETLEHVQGAVTENAVDGEERMMAVVRTLPSMQQTVLRLRHMEGMQMAEIATLIGSTEVAVRKALSRARQAVRREYDKRYRS